MKFANKQKFSEDEDKEEEDERGELEEQPFVIIKSTRDPLKRKEDAYDKLFANGAFDKKRLLRFFRGDDGARGWEDDEDNNRVSEVVEAVEVAR